MNHLLKALALALASALLFLPNLAQAYTCAMLSGKWRCAGADLKEAKRGCEATAPSAPETTCDKDINVCTCHAESRIPVGERASGLKTK